MAYPVPHWICKQEVPSLVGKPCKTCGDIFEKMEPHVIVGATANWLTSNQLMGGICCIRCWENGPEDGPKGE